jgi:tight adherence protein C
MLLILAGLSFAAATFLVAQVATLPSRQRRDLLASAARYGSRPAPTADVDQRAGFGQRVLSTILMPIASVVVRLMPRTTRDSVRQRLLHAGLAPRVTPDHFLGAKGLLAILGGVCGLALGSAISPALGILFPFAAGALGFVTPDVIVNGRVANRRERVLIALPDALDLLAVCVEAGLGFDAALAKLTEYMEGPLIEEFALTLNEMRIGESRTEALRRMATRVGVNEFTAFVRAVVQADRLGTSMGSILRVQSADARVRRHLSAEETAMKAPIKMLFPTLIFIFPAMFIVILGPALINFSTHLK